MEIDRGRLFDWSCDYDTFLIRKEAVLAAEEKQNALFDKKLAQEEAWIRQGIKARRTRNEGRVRALKADASRARAIGATKSAPPSWKSNRRSGAALVAKVDEISFAYGERAIVRDFSTTIMRGDKIGFIGPNGVGKTTLLRLLLGQLPPQAGNVRLGTNLQIAYFDQLREQLDEEATVQENLAPAAKRLVDRRQVAARARLPARFSVHARAGRELRCDILSGGERNRVLLARLFSKPANVIVLDEPTNDLDAETLELLGRTTRCSLRARCWW